MYGGLQVMKIDPLMLYMDLRLQDINMLPNGLVKSHTLRKNVFAVSVYSGGNSYILLPNTNNNSISKFLIWCM